MTLGIIVYCSSFSRKSTEIGSFMSQKTVNNNLLLAQTAEAVEHIDCISAEG